MTPKTTTDVGPVKVNCPACDGEIRLEDDLVVNEIIECGECLSEVEVVGLEPPLIALAPEVEEDWGE